MSMWTSWNSTWVMVPRQQPTQLNYPSPTGWHRSFDRPEADASLQQPSELVKTFSGSLALQASASEVVVKLPSHISFGADDDDKRLSVGALPSHISVGAVESDKRGIDAMPSSASRASDSVGMASVLTIGGPHRVEEVTRGCAPELREKLLNVHRSKARTGMKGRTSSQREQQGMAPIVSVEDEDAMSPETTGAMSPDVTDYMSPEVTRFEDAVTGSR